MEKDKKTTDIIEKFKKGGSSVWNEIKDLWKSLDPDTQKMLLASMFRINPEQAKIFSSYAGLNEEQLRTILSTQQQQKTDYTPLILISAIAVMIIIVIVVLFITRK